MKNLEARLEALEQQAAPRTGFDAIVRRIVTPGRLDAELQHFYADGHTQTWDRRPGESEVAFQDRAVREAKRNTNGIVRLVGSARPKEQMRTPEGAPA